MKQASKQAEFPRERISGKVIAVLCDNEKCRPTSPVTVILQKGIDPEFAVGRCPKCKKQYVRKVRLEVS